MFSCHLLQVLCSYVQLYKLRHSRVEKFYDSLVSGLVQIWLSKFHLQILLYI